MSRHSELTTTGRLIGLGSVVALGLAILLATFIVSIRAVQVHGPLYDEVMIGKDLLADILPPPEFAVEAYSVALRMSASRTPAERARLSADLHRLRREFEDGATAWQRKLEREPVLREAMKRSEGPAAEFFDVVERKLIPACEAGDTARASAALQEAARHYEQHHAALVDLVQATNARNDRLDAKTRNGVARRVGTAIACSLIVLALVGTISVWMARTLRRQLASVDRETSGLVEAVRAGKLHTRGDPEAVGAEFRGVVRGVNEMMDAFLKPIRMSAENMERISRGDVPEPISERYEGEFEKIKESLNRCIGAIAALVEDGKALANAAVAGELSTRADASRHQGDFRRIVEGFNGTLDAVLEPIEETADVLQGLAQRDLRARVKGSYRGDHARITEALNATAQALHDAMVQVAQASDLVSTASAQVASSSQSVASGASEQAGTLEETAANLESMSTSTKQAADSAQQASALASAASSAATDGSAAMEQMITAMARIKTSAEGTSQIIKDINEIAFQTNLLALNAAVEAARAGDAGRGFAVVAEEVRSLALRSKEAASKTEDLIRQSVREATEGEVAAGHVNEKLSEIVTATSKVTGIVGEISAVAAEQVGGIDQVNRAMGQVSSVTQQNAASCEESSSAAQELSGQSQELSAMVCSFRIDAAKRGQPAAARPASRPARSRVVNAARDGRSGLFGQPEEHGVGA